VTVHFVMPFMACPWAFCYPAAPGVLHKRPAGAE
jgi:hypothetical protein